MRVVGGGGDAWNSSTNLHERSSIADGVLVN